MKQWYNILMKNDFTNQVDHFKNKIHVGDLVVLTIPRKERRDKAVIFEVIKDAEYYSIIYSEKFSNHTMSDGDLNYKQDLNHQVYKVVGNIVQGVNEHLFD